MLFKLLIYLSVLQLIASMFLGIYDEQVATWFALMAIFTLNFASLIYRMGKDERDEC